MSKVNYSIIIPHFEIPELLCKCIQSIPQRSDVQVIVVDDYSSDFAEYKQKYEIFDERGVELLSNNDIKSAGSARNLGLKVAKGKWLIFADADDYFSTDFNALLDKYKEVEADIVYFKMDSCYLDTKKQADRHLVYNQKLINAKESGDFNPFIFTANTPCGKMVSRELVNKYSIQFDATPVANDAYFSMKCAVMAKNVLVDDTDPIYVITRREGSLDYTVNKKMDNVRMECAYRINKLLYKYGRGKFRRNMFGISNRFIWKWRYVCSYRNPIHCLLDLSTVVYGQLRTKIKIYV